MSTEADMVAAVEALCGDRLFPDLAPLGTTKPYVTYQQVGGHAPNFLDGGVGGKWNARIQFNVWATTRSEAVSLMRQIEAVVKVTPFFADAEGAQLSRYDEDGELRGAQQDFSFWFT